MLQNPYRSRGSYRVVSFWGFPFYFFNQSRALLYKRLGVHRYEMIDKTEAARALPHAPAFPALWAAKFA
jgi:hypothetical protein